MPERVRSSASKAAMVCFADVEMFRRSSSSVSNPLRITPPSLTFIGGSSLIARSIRSRVSGSSKIFSDNTCSKREVASARTLFTAGACLIERFNASRSRGPAVPRLSRPMSRSRSLISFNRNRIFSRNIVSESSVTAASRVCISLRLSEGRKSHCRKSLEPIPVTV